MQNTVKALAELRAHWKSVGCPPIPQIAKKANVPSATAYRYITGATKGGLAETIRALAIAMDRSDIANAIPYSGISNTEHTEDYIVEFSQQMQEKFQQQLTEVTARHKQEMDDLTRDHRLEREDWLTLRKALHEENVNLRKTFDQTIKIQRREKWISFVLFLASVATLILKLS